MPSRARSLAEDLRGRGDESLAHLLQMRPDLLRPVPKSFSDLALRVNSAPSVLASLDDLTAAQLDVLEACCALAPEGRFGVDDVARGLNSDHSVVTPVVTDLIERVLLWGSDDDLRVPSAVREVMGPEAAGLDPVVRPAFAAIRQQDPGSVEERIALAPDGARDLLRSHAWGPAGLPAGSAAEWLAAHGLAAEEESGRIVVPREVAWALRRGQLLLEPRLLVPQPEEPDEQRLHSTDEHAGHAADQFVRDVDRVLGYLAHGSLGRQANGAFPARDFERLATAVPVGPGRIALILSLTDRAGWVAIDDERRLRPTSAYREHIEDPIARRWAALVESWLTSTRPPTADPARVLAAPELPSLPATRDLILTSLRAGSGADVAAWLTWWRPRRSLDPAIVTATLTDAEMLGVAFAGVLSAPFRDSDSDTADRMQGLLPTLTDRIVLQADLTATSLGPLVGRVERRLAELADWESGGAASVYRFSPDRIRACLARGADPQEVLAWLTEVSATDVPQALQVLLTDSAAALPDLTVHRAGSVVTGTATEVSALLNDPALVRAAFRQVAPGVLTSDLPAGELADLMLNAGHAAGQTDDTDTVVDLPPRPPAATQPIPARVIASLRGVEERRSPEARPPETLRSSGPAQVMHVIQQAVSSHDRLWLSFAGDDGRRVTHLAEPLAVDSGELCAFDHTAGEIRTIPLARIVAFAGAVPPASA